MKFNNVILDYLDGTRFSNGLFVRISTTQSVIYDRLSYIENLTQGKRVIHLGFADHLPLIDDKIRKGVWLHSRILEKAAKCVGVDIDQEAVEYIRSNYNYGDLFCADILVDKIEEIDSGSWDYIVLGEILEHIENPVNFLEALCRKYAGRVDRILISVPNAFSIENFLGVINHSECINTDHKYWFTPYTLAKILTAANIEVANFDFSRNIISPSISTIKRFLISYSLNSLMLKLFPAFSETLIMEGRFLEFTDKTSRLEK